MALSTTRCRALEIEPLICPRCAGDLVPVAAIIADRELSRLLAHLKLPTQFPKTAPPTARSGGDAIPMDHGPPEGEPETQLNPLAERFLGIDEDPNADFLPV